MSVSGRRPLLFIRLLPVINFSSHRPNERGKQIKNKKFNYCYTNNCYTDIVCLWILIHDVNFNTFVVVVYHWWGVPRHKFYRLKKEEKEKSRERAKEKTGRHERGLGWVRTASSRHGRQEVARKPNDKEELGKEKSKEYASSSFWQFEICLEHWLVIQICIFDHFMHMNEQSWIPIREIRKETIRHRS